MANNCGTTSLRRKRCKNTAMHDYDGLPAELRQWVAKACLPWRAKSVRSAYEKALARTGCHRCAMQELDHLQERLVRKDAAQVWGANHPASFQG